METYWIDVCQRANVCLIVTSLFGLGMFALTFLICVIDLSVRDNVWIRFKWILIISVLITILATLGVIFIPTR